MLYSTRNVTVSWQMPQAKKLPKQLPPEVYSEHCLMRQLKKKTKYWFSRPTIAKCRLKSIEEEHSAILLTFIKLPFAIKTFVMSILSGRLKKVVTVHSGELTRAFMAIMLFTSRVHVHGYGPGAETKQCISPLITLITTLFPCASFHENINTLRSLQTNLNIIARKWTRYMHGSNQLYSISYWR